MPPLPSPRATAASAPLPATRAAAAWASSGASGPYACTAGDDGFIIIQPTGPSDGLHNTPTRHQTPPSQLADTPSRRKPMP